MPRETSIPLGQIESASVYELGEERDGCLGNTIASMVSGITGQEFILPPVYYAIRGMMLKDELRAFRKLVRKNPEKPREELDLVMHRLDQRAFKKLLHAIQTTGFGHPAAAPIAAILEDCDVTYQKGDFSDILGAVNAGYAVGVMYKAEDEEDKEDERWWHMAHIGINGSAIVKLSEGNAPITDATIAAINESAAYLNTRARTWNLVKIKQRGSF